MSLGDVTTAAVQAAVAEFDDVGREKFLKRHGYGRAHRYFVEVDGRYYDSKAIVGVAHGYLPGKVALKPSDFSGGEAAAVRVLRSQGFQIADVTEAPQSNSASDEDQPSANALGSHNPAAGLRAIGDNGDVLNARFWVESTGTSFDLVLDSGGGRVRGDNRGRNSDYAKALALLLTRLRDMDATVTSAVVDSARVANLPESERSLIDGPCQLSTVTDINSLRLRLTRAQGRIGLPAGATKEGNNRKRLRLRLQIPAYSEADLDRLTTDLIAACGSTTIDPYSGPLEGRREVTTRGEQARLRRLLANGADTGHCGLCGQQYPLELLVAAHIKRRAVCTEEERRDLRNVAMLACSLGCDILYELGWITVDETGYIRAASDLPATPALRERLTYLNGRSAYSFQPESELYFAWHRSSVFRSAVLP